jgi:hypothetical protein
MLRKWLIGIFQEANKTPGKQITAMTREQLGSVQSVNVSFDKLEEKEKKELLASARRVFEEPAFGFVIHSLLEAQKDFIARYADVDNQLQNYMGRFTINGIALVDEEFERLRSEYLDIIKPGDRINKDDII